MEQIYYEQEEEIGILTVNRPEILNALDTQTLKEMLNVLESETQIGALILTGAGEKAFMAGADIAGMQEMDARQMLQFCELGQKVADRLEAVPFVTIAAVNGYALGGGLEMALACDFIYASRRAELGLPEVKLGLIPGFGGTQRLSREIGMRRAKDMILNGKIISAEEALNIGLINGIYDPHCLLEECKKTASNLLKQPHPALRFGKQAINNSGKLSMDAGLECERNLCATSFATKERQEAMATFLEKKRKR